MSSSLPPGPIADRTGAATAVMMVKFAAPAEVLAGDVSDLFSAAPLRVNFADAGRQFPVHTPSAAWASAAHYHAAGCDDPAVGGAIKSAFARHRLFGEWDRLAEVARPKAEKSASAGRYAVPSANKYPIDTPELVKKAAEYFEAHADRFRDDERKEYALNLAKAAADFRGTLPDAQLYRLEAEGGMGRLSSGWKQAFDDRIKVATRENLPDLAKALTEAASVPPEDPTKAAQHLRRIDRVNRWELNDPLGVMIDLTPTKAAAELASVVKAADGSWYAKADLGAVPDDTVHHLFGTPPVLSAAGRAELLKSAASCGAFRAVLADHGVHPVEHAPRRRVDWAAEAAGASK